MGAEKIGAMERVPVAQTSPRFVPHSTHMLKRKRSLTDRAQIHSGKFERIHQ
jgi:hypothetical protein